MDLGIRKATASDYEDLCFLFDEGDTFHRKNLPHMFQKPESPFRDREYVNSLVSDETVGLFVAQLEDHLIGLVVVVIRDSSAMPIMVPRRYALVDNIVVSEGFRRVGIGRALMEKAREWAVEEGADSIELNVWEFNKEAIEFYQQLGYRTVSQKMSKRLG